MLKPSTLVLYCFSVMAMSVTIAGGDWYHVKPNSAKVNITYESQDISLHEPVIVLFSVRNNSSQPIKLTLGAQSTQFFEFSLTTPEGKTLNSYRDPGKEVDIITVGSGEADVPPGAAYEQSLLMNQWFSFKAPGTYFLRSRLTTNVELFGDGSIAPESETIRLVVKPRDATRLEGLCRKLVRQIEMAESVEAERGPALKLSYVDDPIAVPYLAEVLSRHMYNYHLALPGLERIGNDDAVNVLLSTLGDDFGDMAELARQALSRMQDNISNDKLKERVKQALSSKTIGQG
jgi:hypothetical protein